MKISNAQNKFLFLFLLLAGLTAVLWAVGHYGHVAVPAGMLLNIWRVATLAFLAYACVRRSLTSWIIVGMLAGMEIGHDFPQAAIQLQVLSTIFLRLIKTIVAPLVFSTLVVGVAGHANLKQVG